MIHKIVRTKNWEQTGTMESFCGGRVQTDYTFRGPLAGNYSVDWSHVTCQTCLDWKHGKPKKTKHLARS